MPADPVHPSNYPHHPDYNPYGDKDAAATEQAARSAADTAEQAARSSADTSEATARAAADTAEATARAAADLAAPRGELGYAERQTTDTSSNTVFANIPANLIPGLSVTVVGAGRAVEVEVIGSVYHAVANTYVGFGIVRDGATVGYGGLSSPSTTVGRTVIVKKRMVLVAGQQYVFTVGKYVGAAGVGSFYGDNIGSPLSLSVVER